MSAAEKVGLAIVGVAMATTLVLPNRQTPVIIQRFLEGFGGVLRSATGQ